MKHKIILASKSPRRKKLLKKILKSFRVVSSGVDESSIKTTSPLSFAKKAAILKAKAVAKEYKDAIVIGADTIVVLGKKILGKPRSKADAIAMLQSLSGKTHKVITGVAVVFGEKTVSEVEVTKIKMKKVSKKTILEYVNTGRPMDKAGAYGIQEIEAAFVEQVLGNYDNVVGLPIYRLQKILKAMIELPHDQ